MRDLSASPMPPRLPVSTIEPGWPGCPPSLLRAAGETPGPLLAMGSLEALRGPVLGLLCSVRLPGRLMVETYEWARSMKRSRAVVAGGFHSPMERECFQLMLDGSSRLILCPPRSLAKLRVPRAWRPPIAAGQLLLLSAAEPSVRRATRPLAARRNRFVMALSNALLIPFAGRGGATERLALEAARRGTPFFTFPGPENENLLRMGAQAWGAWF